MTQPNDWREEFDKLPSKKVGQHHYKRTRYLKDFISSFLANERERVVEIIEGLRQLEVAGMNTESITFTRRVKKEFNKGYNQALADLKKRLGTEKSV